MGEKQSGGKFAILLVNVATQAKKNHALAREE